ncbi:MAG: monovalent cation/H+ antiporter subunit D family protein [Thermodesulfobacteriota bacterium]
MIETQAPITILIVPLFAAFAISLFGRGRDHLSYSLLVMAMAGAGAASLVTLRAVLASGPIHYAVGGWPPPIGIELVVDHLAALVLVLVTGCALLTAIYSWRPARKQLPDRLHHYYTLFCLLVTGLAGMVATGDAFNLYVLLEIAALSSYAMLASGRGHAYYATFKYIIMGTIGACFYLLGVGYLYIKTGTLNMADLHRLLAQPGLQDSISIRIGFLLIMVGMGIKMAFFPLHGWLPNAYSRAATATGCLIAPLMTKVAVYVMARMMFSVFSAGYVFETLPWRHGMVALATVAIVAGSLRALAQGSLRRTLAYIIVAEVGYMVGGLWLASPDGLVGALYHMVADGLMTLCLFMAVGAIVHRTGKSGIEAMEGILARMPLTMAVFILGGLAVVGVPPTCGFFSKWYLLRGGIASGQYHYVAALIFSSLVHAVIFYRFLERAWYGGLSTQRHDEVASSAIQEAPASMLAPMLLVAGSLVVFGLYAGEIVSLFIRFNIPSGL